MITFNYNSQTITKNDREIASKRLSTEKQGMLFYKASLFHLKNIT